MQRENFPLALPFARQWTVPSTAGSDAGSTTLDYPSRHAESPSPLSQSQVPRTPSPGRTRPRQPLKGSVTLGSPSPLPPLELSPFASRGAACCSDASLQLVSCPAPVGEFARNFGSTTVPEAVSANGTDGESFWRHQAQRSEATCRALEEELISVYRLLAKDAVGGFRTGVASSPASLIEFGSTSPLYETVLQERNMAQLELAREREKGFLLRYRLREMESEVHRLQRVQCRSVGRQRTGDASKRPLTSGNSAPHLEVAFVQRRRSHSSCCSSSRSSTHSTHHARHSPTYPHSRSSTRPYTPSSARWEESPRPTCVPMSMSSTQRSDDSIVARSSAPPASLPTRREGGCRAATASVEAPATFARPYGHGTNLPANSNRQVSHVYKAESRDLLTWVLSARPSSSASQCQPAAWRKGAAAPRNPGPVRHATFENPPRHVFHSDLFSAAAAISEEEGSSPLMRGPPWDAAETRRAMHHRRLRLPSPLPQTSDSNDNDQTRDHPSDTVSSFCAIPLMMPAARNSVDAAHGALSRKGVPTKPADHWKWVVWQPPASASHQQSGGG
ncbi:hypothetical protein, conserved [Leishmania lindenbergi]|uniref:Uncharacterized protein n=1 Tax=Leishmania lindenbergi TaxID=651832 RepID=A0AAW2ZSV0_9TRYP